jgi:hypothetical protein
LKLRRGGRGSGALERALVDQPAAADQDHSQQQGARNGHAAINTGTAGSGKPPSGNAGPCGRSCRVRPPPLQPTAEQEP